MTPTFIDLATVIQNAHKVEKFWGTEFWVSNSEFCVKVLQINPGRMCSLHCHKIKKEEFHIISGRVKLERDDFTHYMSAGEKLMIQPGSYHRFSSVDGAMILECSTHHDDSDTYRLEDSRAI